MPKVKIQKTFQVGTKKLFAAVQEVLTNDSELQALEPNLEVKTTHEEENKVRAEVYGQRIEGHFEICAERASKKASTIDIYLKLPLTLSPFRSLIQKKIEEKLSHIS